MSPCDRTLNEARGNAVLVEDEPPLPPAPPPAPENHCGSKTRRPRWLHIHVSELSGKRVRANVPLTGYFVPGSGRILPMNRQRRDPHVMDALRTASGTLVEVEDLEDNERVHVFVD
jgi:hypothetical protein